jgi:ABC-type transport system involved in multi-copper enzyme maturation permease subunit
MTDPHAPLPTTPDPVDPAAEPATIEEVGASSAQAEGVTIASTEGQTDAGSWAGEAPRPPRSLGFTRTVGGIAAIGVKETRGRMRGKRAFIVLTIYLLLLAGFAAMVEILVEQSFQTGFGGSAAFASAAIGQGIFTALLMLMTLQVVFLAPSSTAGGISLEREKQTLELLIATPISSLAIVIGKLLSALVWVFLLIAASIPLMAVVFVFGGIGPETVLAGYLVLLATTLGLGSFGLACSSLVKRTTASTAISIFGVLAITIGTAFILIFWTAMGSFDNNGNRVGGLFGMRAPAILAYVNPFIAQADVMCTTESSFGGGWCSTVDGLVPNRNGVVFTDGGAVPVPAPPVIQTIDGKDVVVERGFAEADIAPQQVLQQRDALWPKSVITWLLLSVLFLFIAIQSVSPTRRWRPRLPRRRPDRSTSA